MCPQLICIIGFGRLEARHETESAAMASSRWGNADREKPTFKDFVSGRE